MNDKRKSIAICANANMIGGVEEALVQLLRNIDYSQYSVDLYGSVIAHYAERIPNEVRIIDSHISPHKVLANSLHNKRFADLLCFILNYLMCVLMRYLNKKDMQAFYSMKNFRFYPVVTEKEYDIVVAYTYLVSSVVGDALFRLKGRSKVLWVHGSSDHSEICSQKLDKLIYSKFSKVFCCSNWVGNHYKKQYAISGKKTQTFYNIADTERILTLAEEEIPFTMEKFSIVTVGRLSPEKGQDMIPETVRLLLDSGYDIHWYLVGDGPLRDTIERSIDLHQVADHVIILGTQLNPYPYVKKSNIYVQTSLSEGWCLTTQEAKILCKPIVTTNLPVMTEQFTSGKNGIITEDKSPQALFEGIRFRIEHPDVMECFSSILEQENHDNKSEVAKLYALIDS